MRVLIASSYVPLKNGHGNELQVWHVVDQLRRLHDVEVVYYGSGSDATDVPLHPVPEADWTAAHRAATLARSFTPRGRPSLVAQLDAAGFRERVAQVAARFRPDVLYVTTTQAAAAIEALPTVPRVLNVIDSWAYMEQGMAPNVTGVQQWRQKRRLDAVYRYEKQVLDRFASVITVSDLDRRFMRDMGASVPISVVSNGVDTEFFHKRPKERPAPAHTTLTFHGIMSYVPNEGAGVRLVKDIMPIVWRTRPDVRVQLVGRNPSDKVLALAGDRVEVTGLVEDVRPYLWDAAVCVFPIFAGSGVKNKLLEASSMGKPMVATPSAVGDLALYEGQQALVRTEDDAFAAGILELLADPTRGAQLGASAQQVVESQHSWSEVGRQISAALQDAVSKGAPVR